MKMDCYSIKDEKSQNFMSPFFTAGVVDALRSLTIACNQPESNLNRFPEDFSLYLIAKLDTESGIVTQTGPELISSVKSLIQKSNK